MLLNMDQYFKISLLGSKTIVMTGQAGDRFILIRKSDNGLVGNQPVSVVLIFGKHSIDELSGSRHKLVRGTINSILRPENIRRFVSEMDSIAKRQLFQAINPNLMLKNSLFFFVFLY